MTRLVGDGLEFERARFAWLAVMLCTVGMAAHFAADIAAGRNTITPALYGPIVYAIPAQVWAAVQAGCAGMAAIGLAIGGRRGAVLATLGAALTCALFAAFGALASYAPEGTLVVAICKAVGVPMMGLVTASSLERACRDETDRD